MIVYFDHIIIFKKEFGILLFFLMNLIIKKIEIFKKNVTKNSFCIVFLLLFNNHFVKEAIKKEGNIFY